ncbi:PREDICTED: cell division control protein 45 homolog isoform X2 [Papilio polytes]|uniref:cell division control protein 45 homolog isoform X2 n=1 Tax=Papilio polytes TaxID=76194 RepID=UPI0006767A99|nr:PREDICTED: cell division control protein 45 homolog isoform X2 [Papilio polytes]
MFIEDIRNDFYNVLLGNRVLLLVHYDVDAICACKILQGLFKCDNISYTLVPVGGISELKTAYEENNEEIKYVVLINCGGTIDLVDILQPDEEVVFFVLDSHKPTDICNVYSDGQVRLVYKDDEENIPNFDDIFRDDDDDENEESGSSREGLEALVERRRARKEWEERRHTLMFNYTQFSYYGKPSACVLIELSSLASRLSQAALWAAAVAAEAHAALYARSPARCLLDAEALHRYVAAARRHDDSTANRTACVVMEKDAWLPLYREWTLEAALSHAAMLAPKLKLYARSGSSRLRQLLADMGFPLQQARQAYRSMDVELRRSLLTALETAAPKHKLPVPTKATFILQRPLMAPLAALDAVYVIMALIEHVRTRRGAKGQLRRDVPCRPWPAWCTPHSPLRNYYWLDLLVILLYQSYMCGVGRCGGRGARPAVAGRGGALGGGRGRAPAAGQRANRPTHMYIVRITTQIRTGTKEFIRRSIRAGGYKKRCDSFFGQCRYIRHYPADVTTSAVPRRAHSSISLIKYTI